MAVYMAVDYGNSDSWNDYMIEIGFLKSLLDSDDHCGADLLGDYNADLRYMKSRFDRQLDTFVTDNRAQQLTSLTAFLKERLKKNLMKNCYSKQSAAAASVL